MSADQSQAEPVRVYIGLGSNLDGPKQQIRRALSCLSRLPSIQLTNTSCLYRSPPMGPSDQPDYINAVAEMMATCPPLDLLGLLQDQEQQQGRQRQGLKWGPRTLDLDLLLFGRQRIEQDRLCVPHPGLAERPFVLYPLAEIAPDLDIPGHGPIQALLASCPVAGLERIE